MIKNAHLNYFLLSIASAVFFAAAWIPINIIPLLFFAFGPLFFLEKRIRENEKFSRLWILVYGSLSFFLLNYLTTYWIWNASPGGAIAAWFIDTFLMLLPFFLFHLIKLKSIKAKEYWSFIALWISIELLHLRWEFAFPWLTLGNAFAPFPQLVQWYEYTGVFGGSFWVLAANYKLYQLILLWKEKDRSYNLKRVFNLAFVLFFLPVFLSYYITPTKTDEKTQKQETNIVVVQPNFDPYQKFESMSPMQQLQRILQLAETKLDSQTQLLIFPETALQGGLDERNLAFNPLIVELKHFLKKHSGLNILSGADTYKFFEKNEVLSKTARQYDSELWYDSYNTAILVNANSPIQIYHKSKLVPGVENIPYASAFGFLKNFVIDLGGSSGSLGSDGEAKVFIAGSKNTIAPIICYESVFGDFVKDFVKKDAGIICIITNDAWWGNTAGYKQHFEYSRLRAIETRRSIARCANTGVSGFIDSEGNVLQKTSWWTEAVIKQNVSISSSKTFYLKYGDWIASIAVVFALMKLYELIFKKRSH